MCTRRRIVKNPDPMKYIGPTLSIPCGKCPECLKERQDSWKLRLLEESNNYVYLYFFTLTYSDDALPLTDRGLSTARKSDVQLWLKRFRTAFERAEGRRLTDVGFKYFICAEYGPNGTHRPHYHGLIMSNLDEDYLQPLFDDWSANMGFVKLDYIPFVVGERQAVANYVSKYCCKGEFASRVDDIEAGLIENAWTICSKSIGLSYVERMRRHHTPKLHRDLTWDYLDQVIDRMKVVIESGGKSFTYRMPRYYRERLYNEYRLFDKDVWDQKNKCYVKKKVGRFSAKNLFSYSLSCRVRDRFLDKNRKFEELTGLAQLSDTDPRLYAQITSQSADSLAFREHKIRRDLLSFYSTNKAKYSHL